MDSEISTTQQILDMGVKIPETVLEAFQIMIDRGEVPCPINWGRDEKVNWKRDGF